jgi:hypothetical protein
MIIIRILLTLSLSFLLLSGVSAHSFGQVQTTLVHYEDSQHSQQELRSSFSFSNDFEGNYRVCQRDGSCRVQNLDYSSYRRNNGANINSIELNRVQVLFGR